MNIKNFGKKSADEVIERLKQFGLGLTDMPK
jgi:DNA-directed RNA polymerase alpha subunit